MAPHPSETDPQAAPNAAHVVGVHLLAPHWLGPPPPHVAGAMQLPQLSVPPHPSGIVPHAAF
jgi:hypothetical protein